MGSYRPPLPEKLYDGASPRLPAGILPSPTTWLRKTNPWDNFGKAELTVLARDDASKGFVHRGCMRVQASRLGQ